MLVGDLPQLPRGDTPFVGRREVEERRQYVGLEDAILIENEQEWRGTAGGVGIVPATEADVDRGALHIDARECATRLQRRQRRDARGCPGLLAVVENQGVDSEPRDLLDDARDELLEQGKFRVEGDDADVNHVHVRLA